MIRFIKFWLFWPPFVLLYVMTAIGLVLAGVPGSWLFATLWLIIMVSAPNPITEALLALDKRFVFGEMEE